MAGLGAWHAGFLKFMCKGPGRALTDTLRCFQGRQCIYITFLDPKNFVHDSRGHSTKVPHKVAWLLAEHAGFQKVCARRLLEGINRHIRVISMVSMHLYNLFGSTKICWCFNGSQDWILHMVAWFGCDMPDSQMFVCEGLWRASTDNLGCFQGCQCIYVTLLEPQKIFRD